jgi:eukaryotic-like serine/threonine-protein kinase
MMPGARAVDSRSPLVAFGPFVFDAQNGLLSRGGAEIPLPPRVLGVLELLLSRPGEVVLRQELLDRVWKDAFVTDTSLAEAISFLRQALGDDPQAPRFIQTVHRRGYRFVAIPAAAHAEPVGESAAQSAIHPSIARDLVPWSVAALCAALALAALWQTVHQLPPEAPPVVRLELRPASGSSFDDRSPALAVSPDGRTIVWSACHVDTAVCGLWVRQLDRFDPVRLNGTDGAHAPFFSPDGRWVGFFADGKLKKIAITGGSAVSLADAASPGGASWGPDGQIVFSGRPAGGLALTSEQGGDVRALTTPRPDRGEVRHLWPSWLSTGRGIIFTIAGSPVPGAPGQLGILPMPSASWRLISSGVIRGVPAGRGYLLMSTGTDLRAQTFDERTLALTGASDSVLEGLADAQGVPQFSVSTSGTLAALGATGVPDRITWADDSGRALDALAHVSNLTISPDGRRAAGVRVDATGSDIWIVDLDRGSATRVTYGGTNASPVWTPDGSHLLVASRATGPFTIVRYDTGGAANVQTLLRSDAHLFPGSVTSDGRIAVVKTLPDGRTAVGIAARAGAEPVLFNDGPFNESMPVFSPDGEWLAFASDESGRLQIYVRDLRVGRRIALSTNDAERPAWSADGRWIYFYEGRRLMRCAFDREQESPAGKPVVVFDRPDARVLAAAPNGRVLIEEQPVAQNSAQVVVQGLREIRQRLPPPITAPR